MFDSHCHLDFPELSGALASELSAARARGVDGWLVPGCAPEQWGRLKPLRDVPGVRIAVGIHPWWVPELAASGPHALSDALAHVPVEARRLGAVALGECGLDVARAGRDTPELALQAAAFEAQLEVASELELPVVLHVVRAHDEVLGRLRRSKPLVAGGVVHGFSGSVELAREYVTLGLFIGIGLRVTSEQNRKLREVAAGVPLDRLLLETDAPDQRLPGALAETAHGRPSDLPEVARAVAELRGLPVAELGRVTAENARRLFAG